jgi:hypothetical protein
MTRKICKPIIYVGCIETSIYDLVLAKSLIDQIYNIFEDFKILGVMDDQNKLKFDQIGYLLRVFEDKLNDAVEELEETAKDLKASLTLPNVGCDR